MPDENLSIVSGIPLSEEQGIGAMTVAGYLREVTERYAANEALVYHDDGSAEVRWSYTDLWEKSLTVARALVASGVGKDTRVGLLMTNRPEWFAAMFGIALAGGVAVQISTFSTQPELEYLLQASDVSVLLFEAHILKKDFAGMLLDLEPGIAAATPGRLASNRFSYLRHLVAVGGEPVGAIESWNDFVLRSAEIRPELVVTRAASIAPSDRVAVFFSSGSTSKPKGVLISQRAIAIQMWRMHRYFALEGTPRSWAANGFFWCAPFAIVIGGTFSRGGAVILQSTFQAEEAVRLLESEKVSFAFAAPHQWAQIEQAPNWAGADLAALRHIDADSSMARHSTIDTDWKVPTANYGGTETFTFACALPTGMPAEVTGGGNGIPLPGNTIKIVDPDTGAVLPRGERGEIGSKGPTLMLGYLGRSPEETFDAEGFFRSGDGGYIDAQGRLFWEGRLSEIIKTGGANVSPVEVDAALADCPGIKITKTVGVPDKMLGEMVVACIVLEDSASLSEAEVREFLKDRLASFKIPRRVVFFAEADLPLTNTAKIKSKELRAILVERGLVENA